MTRTSTSSSVPSTIKSKDEAQELPTVTTLPLPNPSADTSHHVGNPPTSFRNPWPSFTTITRSEIFWTRFGNHPEKNPVPVPQGPNGTRSNELVTVRKPTWGTTTPSKLRATWLGHASFLIETPVQTPSTRGVRILLDPVFSERTSPVTFFGPKRYTPPPCTIDELPPIDIICISHNHYDHMDITTLKALHAKQNGQILFFAPLGNKTWLLNNINCTDANAFEMDWWTTHAISIPAVGTVELTCCPAQHNSGRGALDHGSTLWSSWALSTPTSPTQPKKSLFFAGDTGYQAPSTPTPCPAFAEIGTHLGPFDLALLPIGLCTPASFMGSVHATPEQSLRMAGDLRAKRSLGMHYGTVRGGISGVFEDVRDPPRRWRKAALGEGRWVGGGVEGGGREGEWEGGAEGGCGLCDVGETVGV